MPRPSPPESGGLPPQLPPGAGSGAGWRPVGRVRVLVVDRPGWVYHATAAVAGNDGTLELIGRAVDVADAARFAAQGAVHIVLLHFPRDIRRGLDALRQLRRDMPGTRILVFASAATLRVARAVTAAGAAGVLSRDDEVETLASVIRTVLAGETYRSAPPTAGSPAVTETPAFPRQHQLTAREWNVLELVCEGLTSRAIAHQLGIELTTVHAHRSNIMKKLDIHKVAALVTWYERHRNPRS